MSGAPPTRARQATVALVVLGLAVAVRLAIVFTTDRVLEPSAENDEGQYFQLARNLAEGRGISVGTPPEPTAVRTPGYPMALAGAFALAGPSLRAGLVVGALADGITAALLALLVMRLVGSAARAFAAGFAWALLSPYLWWMDYLYPDPLGATLVTAAVLAALVAVKPRSGAWSGIAWGAAVLTRPFLLVAAIGSLITLRRRTALVGLTALALAVLPWTIRNAAIFHRLIPLSTGGTGMNLWVGTWNDAQRPVVELRATPAGPVAAFSSCYFDSEEERVRAEAAWNDYMDEFLGRGSPRITEPDARLRAIAVERIRRDPGRWITLRLRNVALAWTLPDVPRGRWVGVPILALALAGAVQLARSGRRREVLVICTPLLLLALTLLPLRTEARYVAAGAPLLFALAAAVGSRSHDPLAVQAGPAAA